MSDVQDSIDVDELVSDIEAGLYLLKVQQAEIATLKAELVILKKSTIIRAIAERNAEIARLKAERELANKIIAVACKFKHVSGYFESLYTDWEALQETIGE
jgi:hypothetical protein